MFDKWNDTPPAYGYTYNIVRNVAAFYVSTQYQQIKNLLHNEILAPAFLHFPGINELGDARL
jgi:hypothetical protein